MSTILNRIRNLEIENAALQAEVARLQEVNTGIYYEFAKLTEYVRDNHFVVSPPNLSIVRESQVHG